MIFLVLTSTHNIFHGTPNFTYYLGMNVAFRKYELDVLFIIFFSSKFSAYFQIVGSVMKNPGQYKFTINFGDRGFLINLYLYVRFIALAFLEAEI